MFFNQICDNSTASIKFRKLCASVSQQYAFNFVFSGDVSEWNCNEMIQAVPKINFKTTIKSKCHWSITADIITFVFQAFQSLLDVFLLVEDPWMIYESIYYFSLRLYDGAFTISGPFSNVYMKTVIFQLK